MSASFPSNAKTTASISDRANSVGLSYLLLVDLNIFSWYIIPMKNTYSYTAGYIDGDGCFFLCKEANPLKYRAHIIISSTNHDVLEFFKDCFGGSIYLTPKRFNHWKPTYHWMIRGKFALEFSYKIIDILTEKKGDALIFIDYVNTSCKLKKQELINTMRDHRDEIREINADVVEKIRAVPLVGVTDELNYPYLAGFIDAECCLGVSKYKPKDKPNYTYKISLQCTNTNPTIFFWLMERFGGSITHVKRNQKNPRHRDQIIWNLTSDALYKVLPKLIPWLRAKKEVCKKLIELHETVLTNGGDRQSKEFKDSYANILSIRDKIVDEIHHLNSKGVNNVQAG